MGRSLAAHQRSDLLRLVAILRVHLNLDMLGW